MSQVRCLSFSKALKSKVKKMSIAERDRFFQFLAFSLGYVFFFTKKSLAMPHMFSVNRITGELDFWNKIEVDYSSKASEWYMFLLKINQGNALLKKYFDGEDNSNTIDVVEMAKNGLFFFDLDPELSDVEIRESLTAYGTSFKKNAENTAKNILQDVSDTLGQWRAIVEKYGGEDNFSVRVFF